MDYYCEDCDKTIATKSKRSHLQSLTYNEFEKCKQIQHTIQNPDFFDADSKFHEYITTHNKNFETSLVK